MPLSRKQRLRRKPTGANRTAIGVTGNQGGPFTITFIGALAGQNVSQLATSSSALATTATVIDGSSGTGDIYSYGAAASTERALGELGRRADAGNGGPDRLKGVFDPRCMGFDRPFQDFRRPLIEFQDVGTIEVGGQQRILCGRINGRCFAGRS